MGARPDTRSTPHPDHVLPVQYPGARRNGSSSEPSVSTGGGGRGVTDLMRHRQIEEGTVRWIERCGH